MNSTGLPTRIPADVNADGLIKAMGTDKKRKEGRVRFVIMREVGDVFINDKVPETAVRETLQEVVLPA